MKYQLVTTEATVYARYLVAIEDDQDEQDAVEAVFMGEVDQFDDEFGCEDLVDNETITDEEIQRLVKWTHMEDWSLSQIKEMTHVAERDPV
jgi:hypothetical protein